MEIETPRLILRRLLLSDFDNFYAKLYSNRDVMQYVRTGQPKTKDETLHELKVHIEHFDAHSFGFLAVLEKASGCFLGISGLKYLSDTDDVQVGFLFDKTTWGKGYATEVTKELIAYGFNGLRLKKIVAISRPENIGSRRVLEKCGLIFQGIKPLMEYDWAYYEINTDRYSQLYQDKFKKSL
jgi:RimJ/RimL family protein N-acetyltransferase